jgi:hypothetical protein
MRMKLDELVKELVEVLVTLRAADVLCIGRRRNTASRTEPSAAPVESVCAG